MKIQGYVDADYVGDLDQKRSLTSCIFMFDGNVIS